MLENRYEAYGDPRIKTLLDRIWEVHCRKARDYVPLASPDSNLRASEKLGIPAWVGVLLRMNDKMTRLNEFARTGHLANEGVEDTLLDLANYALLDLILFQETVNVQTGKVHGSPGDPTPGGNGPPLVEQPGGNPDAGREDVPAGQLRDRPEVDGGRPAQAAGQVDPGRPAEAGPERGGGAFDGTYPNPKREVRMKSVGPPNAGDEK